MWGGGRAVGVWKGRSGPLVEARSMRTGGCMGHGPPEKSACFVMEFNVMRACAQVGKGAMMIPQPSLHRGCVQLA